MVKLLISITLIFSLIACGKQSMQSGTDTTSTSTQTASTVVNQLFDNYQQENFALNPGWASFWGVSGFAHSWVDPYHSDYFEASETLERKYLSLATAMDRDTLPQADQLSLDIFIYDRQMLVDGFETGAAKNTSMLSINQFGSAFQYMVLFGSGVSQPFNTVEDYDNWLKRASAFPATFDSAIALLREGIEQKVVLPSVLAEKMAPQFASQLVTDATKSTFYQAINNMPDTFPTADKDRLAKSFVELIEKQLIPNFKKLNDFVIEEYLPATRDTHGLGALPDGDKLYSHLIRTNTTTELDAEAIHEMGLNEVKRLFNEMEKVKDKVAFEGDMQAFFEFLRTDPQFYYTSADALIQGYEDLRSVINPKLPLAFKQMPKTDYVIKPIEPFREKSDAAAGYMPGSPDGSRPGIFYLNTYDLSARPKYLMEALSIHEASPGHHFQISLSQEAGDIPDFRKFSLAIAYIEGWGLYSETIGLDMGLYQDPYQYFGMLYMQIWRANRLVVDTGLHAKGWTRQQAIDFMRSNSPMTQTDVVAEVERYMAIPGQALAYMVGRMKLQALRERAEQTLGDSFDVRDFHHQVLKDGTMPMAILEQKIDRWIAANK